ncbi:DUF2802 domain-containing protein [Vibrio genomosp. F6]|uniref:DUF2802 domain-containing protein n=1 Tax=Vibrio genomosp. F6 TaxID=723172 RepID=UPI0010BDF908|nr:DUF2802 domain-containing protein [Vibrio genomosp. F6]TKF22633.1 DUF2802 domain-containing protein [Vibrio genomosp. F6]
MTNVLSQNIPFLIGGGVLIALLFVLALFRTKQASQKLFDASRLQTRHLEKELQKANKQLLEVRSVVVGLGQRVTEQQDIIKHLNERVVELEHVDTDGRLYTRASKMVQLGASVNELIEECEIPKAEAELMMSLQNKLTGKEKLPPLRGTPRSTGEHRASPQSPKNVRR